MLLLGLPPLHWAAAGAALAATAAAYRAAPANDFVFDDHLAVVRNADTDPSDTEWEAVWRHDFWGRPLSGPDSNRSYRPLTILSFRFSHWLRGGRDAAWEHAANVALHMVATLLCYRTSVWHGEATAGRDPSSVPSVLAAATSAALFGVHPVHAEAVTGVVGRAELLSLCFGAAAVSSYVRSPATTMSIASFAAALCCSVLSKETGITFVAVAFVTDLVLTVRRRGPWRSHVLKAAAAAALTGGYLALRKALLGTVDLAGSPLLRRTENPILFVTGPSKLLSSLYVQVKYLQLLILPADLLCEYPFDCIPIVGGMEDGRAWAAVGLAAAAVAAAVASAVGAAKGSSLVPLVAWTVLPQLPATGLVATVGTVLGERLLYSPSFGYCLLVGHVTAVVAGRSQRRAAVAALCVCAATCAWSAQLHERNLEWRTDESLFESAVRVCPRGAKLHQQLGLLRMNQGRMEEALHHVETAAAIDPEWCEPPLYIGKYWAHKGPEHYDTAMLYWRRCVSCPWVMDQCFRLYHGVQLQYMTRSNASAHSEMAEVLAELRLWPQASAAHRQAGLIWFNAREWRSAAKAMGKAVDAWHLANPAGAPAGRRDPDLSESARKIQNIRASLGLEEPAVLPEESTVEHPCNMWYWQGHALREAGKGKRAAAVFERQLDRCRHEPRAVIAAARGLQDLLEPVVQNERRREKMGVPAADVSRLLGAASAAIAASEGTPLDPRERADRWTAAARLYAHCGAEVRQTRPAVSCGCYADAAAALRSAGGGMEYVCGLVHEALVSCRKAEDWGRVEQAKEACGRCPDSIIDVCLDG